MALAAVLLVARTGRADSTSDNPSEVKQASYSTSKNGKTLKWMPSREAAAKAPADNQAVQVQHVVSADATSAPTTSGDAFADPFGDRKRKMVPVVTRDASAAPSVLRDEAVPDFPAGSRSAPRPMPALTRLQPAATAPATTASEQTPAEKAQLEELLKTGKANGVPAADLKALQEWWPGATAAERADYYKKNVKPATRDSSSIDSPDAGPSPRGLEIECPTKRQLGTLKDIKLEIRPESTNVPKECEMLGTAYQPRNWGETNFTWKASSLCHKPTYFEQTQLERYGHYVGPVVQPFLAAGEFFLTIPLLPYKMGLELPGECVYSLGYYRPGSCSPYILDPLPLSARAALFEAGAVVGLAAFLP